MEEDEILARALVLKVQEDMRKEVKNGTAPNPGPKVKCKQCGDIIQSGFRWDMTWCKGKHIAIDGGGEYLKCVGNPEDFDWLN